MCVCAFDCHDVSVDDLTTGRMNEEGLMPDKQCFAGMHVWMYSRASYVSHSNYITDDVIRYNSQIVKLP